MMGDYTKSKLQISRDILAFVGEYPEFWADFAAYDWVALCQLYGPMVNLPTTWPYFCRDVQQFRKMLGKEKFSVNEACNHNALEDARETKARYDVLADVAGTHKMGLAL
jgi:hypothetical protein